MKKRVRRTTSHAHHRRRFFTRRHGLIAIAILVGLFVVTNVGMLVAYHNKALPGYSVGDLEIGGKTYAQISADLETHSLPQQITLVKDSSDQQLSVSNLGVSIDHTKTLADVKHKSLVPLFSLLRTHTVPLVLSADQNAMARYLDQYTSIFTKPATDKHIAFTGKEFGVLNAASGYTFNKSDTATAIVAALADGAKSITAVTNTTPAGTNSGDLTAPLAALNKQLQNKIAFAYQLQAVQPSPAEMGAWFMQDGQSMKLSDDQIGSYLDTIVTRVGGSMANRSDLILAIKYSMSKNQSNNLRISPQSASLRTYCTAVRGVAATGLEELAGKLATTYADTRGWNDGGLAAFQHVASGCQYTVWLTTPAQMTSFGAICDDYYNCQVGSNVVINNDRWLSATDSWNKTGQGIENYRLLIINHETGHRLGFRDNNVCPGAGQPAYVMMQQSIDLKGCAFNVWPTSAELTTLKSML